MSRSNDLAALIGFACEAVLFGVNATFFLVSIIIITQKRHQTRLKHPVVLLNCLIFLCCTTHFTLELQHFQTHLARSGVDGFGDETRSLLGADILISVTDVLGEIILMYRCWLLYEKNYLVITIPCLATFGGLACIAGVAHFEVSSKTPATALPVSIIPLLLAGYSLLLFANVLTTGLIIYRIWYTSSTLPNVHRIVTESASRRAIMLIIESGTLYILAELFIVVVFALNSPVQAVAGVVAVQIYGIAPSLIVVGIGLGTSSEQFSRTIVSTWVARRDYPSEATGPQYEIDGHDTELGMEVGTRMKDLSMTSVRNTWS